MSLPDGSSSRSTSSGEENPLYPRSDDVFRVSENFPELHEFNDLTDLTSEFARDLLSEANPSTGRNRERRGSRLSRIMDGVEIVEDLADRAGNALDALDDLGFGERLELEHIEMADAVGVSATQFITGVDSIRRLLKELKKPEGDRNLTERELAAAKNIAEAVKGGLEAAKHIKSAAVKLNVAVPVVGVIIALLNSGENLRHMKQNLSSVRQSRRALEHLKQIGCPSGSSTLKAAYKAQCTFLKNMLADGRRGLAKRLGSSCASLLLAGKAGLTTAAVITGKVSLAGLATLFGQISIPIVAVITSAGSIYYAHRNPAQLRKFITRAMTASSKTREALRKRSAKRLELKASRDLETSIRIRIEACQQRNEELFRRRQELIDYLEALCIPKKKDYFTSFRSRSLEDKRFAADLETAISDASLTGVFGKIDPKKIKKTSISDPIAKFNLGIARARVHAEEVRNFQVEFHDAMAALQKSSGKIQSAQKKIRNAERDIHLANKRMAAAVKERADELQIRHFGLSNKNYKSLRRDLAEEIASLDATLWNRGKLGKSQKALNKYLADNLVPASSSPHTSRRKSSRTATTDDSIRGTRAWKDAEALLESRYLREAKASLTKASRKKRSSTDSRFANNAECRRSNAPLPPGSSLPSELEAADKHDAVIKSFEDVHNLYKEFEDLCVLLKGNLEAMRNTATGRAPLFEEAERLHKRMDQLQDRARKYSASKMKADLDEYYEALGRIQRIEGLSPQSNRRNKPIDDDSMIELRIRKVKALMQKESDYLRMKNAKIRLKLIGGSDRQYWKGKERALKYEGRSAYEALQKEYKGLLGAGIEWKLLRSKQADCRVAIASVLSDVANIKTGLSPNVASIELDKVRCHQHLEDLHVHFENQFIQLESLPKNEPSARVPIDKWIHSETAYLDKYTSILYDLVNNLKRLREQMNAEQSNIRGRHLQASVSEFVIKLDQLIAKCEKPLPKI